MLTVGFSRIKSWRRCRRLHNYRYRQFLKRRKPSLPLLRGTILHEMLDAKAKDGMTAALKVLAKYDKQYRSLFKEEREIYGDLIEDCRTLFQNYCDCYAKDGLQLVVSEHEITITLVKDKVVFHGTIDRVFFEKQRKFRWLSDTKTHKNIPGEENRFHDLQTLFYVWAWNEVNPRRPVDGVMWDYIRTKLPAVPELLKSGKLSQRANIDTTYAVASHQVAQHCAATGEDPNDYAEWLETLKGREGKFLKRVTLPNPPRVMIDQIVAEMKATALEMYNNPDSDERTMTKDCSFCEFRDLCHAELRGQDSDFVRKSEFLVDKELKEDYSEEE